MKVLLIDDQKNHLEYLEIQLKSLYSDSLIIDTIQNPITAINKLKNETFDLIFLDIEMPELTGFELIEITGLSNLPPIIFTTSYSKYAVEAFKVNAIDYLLKPINLNELSRAVERAMQFKTNQQKLQSIIEDPPVTNDYRIVIVQGQTYLFIPYSDIIRIEGKGSYSDFHLLDGRRITTSKRLNIYWKQLDKAIFFKPHKSHIVNQNHVIGYSKSDGGMILLKNKHDVPVSTQLREKVKQRLKF